MCAARTTARRAGTRSTAARPWRDPLAVLDRQPASCRSSAARRSSRRSCPEPSVTGGTKARRTPRRAPCRGTVPAAPALRRDGLPFAIMSEFWKHRVGALVRPVHDVLVGPFEIEGERSASRSCGCWNCSRRVLMNQPCAPEGVSSGSTSRLTRPSRIAGKIVARRPDARGELLAEQIALGGEAFEADVAVAVVFEAHDVEIVLAADDRQIRRPTSPCTRSNSM